MTSHLRFFRLPLRNLSVGAALLFLTAATAAQEPQTVFLEGMTAYHSGDYEGAMSKFREVIRLDPSQAQAVAMLNESQDALLTLLVAGDEFEVFARHILETAREERGEVMRDVEAAAAAAEQALTGDYADRSRAIFSLGVTYGPFAVPPLVSALGSDQEERRLNAIYALARVGNDALVPLLAASHSDNPEVRRGVLLVLGQLNDPRSAARLADMARNDPDGTVRVLAESQAGGGDPAALLNQQGWDYYLHDPLRGLTEVENYGVLWSVDGSRLSAHDVPPAVVPIELAKRNFLRAAELGHHDAASGLALCYASEIVALEGKEELAATRASQANAALTLSQQDLDRALTLALDRGQVLTAHALIDLLSGPGLAVTGGLSQALLHPVPSLRFAAALALADHGAASSEVVSALGDAVRLEALRVVHVVDADSARAARLRDQLAASHVVVVMAEDGTDGLINASRGMVVDAFVVADPLPDMYARLFVRELRHYSQYGESPVLVLGGEETGEIEGAQVQAEVNGADVMAAFGELGEERDGYLATAAQAARALAQLALRDPYTVGAVNAQLLAAAGRQDDVAVSALQALERSGDGASAPALVAIVADGGRSPEARTAAANALAGVLSRNPMPALNAREPLEAALAEGDAALGRACARALGLLGGGHSAATVVP